MRWRPLVIGACINALAVGCASRPDHFYTLSTLPDAARAVSSAPTVHVLLNVTVPVLVDRGEMIVSTDGNEISILDHERWAAPLSDLVSQTLARDIEQRRGDVMVADRRFVQENLPPVTLKVDIVRMVAHPGARASIEAHWRIVDVRAGLDKIGSGGFEAPLEGSGYAAIAHGYSLAVGELADALARELARP
jgi:uncharacterized lipoprotein YmbA